MACATMRVRSGNFARRRQRGCKAVAEKSSAVFEDSKTALCRLEDFRAQGIASEAGAVR
jgi:hypothetical protein